MSAHGPIAAIGMELSPRWRWPLFAARHGLPAISFAPSIGGWLFRGAACW